MMSRAPASAASASGTSFSAETNSAAFAEHSEDWLLKMKSASGSSPLSRATVARVLRFGLNGWYMSSSFASRFGGGDCGGEFVGEKVALGERLFYRLPPVVECFEAFEPVAYCGYRDFVEGTRGFFSVPRDKRHRSPVSEELGGRGHLHHGNGELFCD